MTPEDEAHLRRAIRLAGDASAAGDRPYAALLVADGEILAEDRNTVISDGDITAHPELKLARWAAKEMDRERARRTTMYTSCQPCAMCTGAIERSGLGRVVFALSTEQRRRLVPEDAAEQPSVVHEGPALFEEARRPLEAHGG